MIKLPHNQYHWKDIDHSIKDNFDIYIVPHCIIYEFVCEDDIHDFHECRVKILFLLHGSYSIRQGFQ
jgi:hypothetical protein